MEASNALVGTNQYMLYMLLFMLMGVIVYLFQSCYAKKKENIDESKLKMIETDRAFAEMCETQGQKAAFKAYMADSAVLLRPQAFPIEGKKAINVLLENLDDSDYTLTWEPLYVEMASSADLGYTYGTYTLKYKNSEKEEQGTYTSIWQKQANKQWKWVLDTGNQGVSNG